MRADDAIASADEDESVTRGQIIAVPLKRCDRHDARLVTLLFTGYGLHFTDAHLPAVLETDAQGATAVSIGLGRQNAARASLIFHYSLRPYESAATAVDDAAAATNGDAGHVDLKRFVMQSTSADRVNFRVHVRGERPACLSSRRVTARPLAGALDAAAAPRHLRQRRLVRRLPLGQRDQVQVNSQVQGEH